MSQERFPIAHHHGASGRAQPAWAPSSGVLETYGRIATANDPTVRAYADTVRALSSAPFAAPFAIGRNLEPGGSLLHRSVLTGVGLGAAPDFGSHGDLPGLGCLHLYTSTPMGDADAAVNAISAFGIESLLSPRVSVRAIHTGLIDAYVHRVRWRPLHSGCSIAHHRVSAGTLGCHATRDNGATLVLSNNHVLADVNAGQVGDDVLQTSPYDGGVLPGDLAGALEDFVPISFSSDNTVDCATALIDVADVSREFIFEKSGGVAFYQVGAGPAPARVGLRVGKSGRTTGLTSGVVTAVGAFINVNMGGGRVARFVDQIAVTGSSGPFSQPGDSGSLIWTWDDGRAPVGLLFAGGGGTTFANGIDNVLAGLDISLVV